MSAYPYFARTKKLIPVADNAIDPYTIDATGPGSIDIGVRYAGEDVDTVLSPTHRAFHIREEEKGKPMGLAYYRQQCVTNNAYRGSCS